ncbi:MAG: AmmeMemoRadiSam system radical SAM enzyme [Planctomycetes bacterium]|nr:AmmeMemoRadiSam system radical SAM enzyme [Planctomycetota bacterium]
MKPDPVPARYYERFPDGNVSCQLCPQECFLKPGATGICGVRRNRDGRLMARSYGAVTASALDPVEKKPLYHFFPGREIFSIGGWGCNLHCVFCQNSPISQFESPTVPMSPVEVAAAAVADGSIGAAYTYNEPVIAIEYVMDCAREVRRRGGKNVLVTNGFILPGPLADLLPVVDAMNIDLKGFNNDFYRRLCGGRLEPVLDTIAAACRAVHVELTTLLIPDANDAVPELEDQAEWIAATCGRAVPVHLTAYHPSYNYTRAATTAAHLRHAWGIFREKLDYVYLGNIVAPGAGDTLCVHCGNVVIRRQVFDVDTGGMRLDGACARCGGANNIVTS